MLFSRYWECFHFDQCFKNFPSKLHIQTDILLCGILIFWYDVLIAGSSQELRAHLYDILSWRIDMLSMEVF